ncbi:hypothetical protein BIW11_02984 [Tropilaelaps mercedesae]|uniref:Uncharacterized protein n=1 Tax=Tropilaelaps mercedesae TaxID=418985 RepID=A0A1V9XTT9_9ACAR|nr:hypothetical protein BIW11_02984 [Tropilaelaps mercedesae]
MQLANNRRIASGEQGNFIQDTKLRRQDDVERRESHTPIAFCAA